jgi:hypothetical protein
VSNGVADWSNAKKARTFAHIIAHLVAKYGDHGVLRVPMSKLGDGMTVGFDREGDDLLIAVDMDRVKNG